MHISPRTADVAIAGQLGQQWLDRVGAKPCLAGSPETLTSRRMGQDGGLRPVTRRPPSSPRRAPSSRGTVDRMDHGHQRQRPPDLVPLQGADHVPADRQVGQGRGLLPKLLRPALAQVDAAGRNQGRIASADTYFVTATSVTSSAARPARAAAAAIRPRTSATFSAIRAA